MLFHFQALVVLAPLLSLAVAAPQPLVEIEGKRNIAAVERSAEVKRAGLDAGAGKFHEGSFSEGPHGAAWGPGYAVNYKEKRSGGRANVYGNWGWGDDADPR